MDTLQHTELTGERLTWDEIKRRFPNQWVVMTDLDPSSTTKPLRTAVVRGHGKTRQESWAQANLPDGSHFAQIPRRNRKSGQNARSGDSARWAAPPVVSPCRRTSMSRCPRSWFANSRVPRHHNNPFDRFLVAQAQIEALTLVTADNKVGEYVVPLLWVSG